MRLRRRGCGLPPVKEALPPLLFLLFLLLV
jgi:hypothetical protein